MKLTFKQKFFSILDSYDVYNENNEIYFKVKGKLSLGHLFKIYDKNNEEIGTVKQKILTFIPRYELYKDKEKLGEITKEISLFRPKFTINFDNYEVDGDFLEWEYKIKRNNEVIASITKKLFNLIDTYTIDVKEKDALLALMIVLAIDSNKDQRNRHDN